MNKAILLGRIGKDPELKEFASGKVCSFSLATSRKYKDKAGETKEETQWHTCQAWGNTADLIAKYVKQGDQLSIEGSIIYEKYKDKEGVDKQSTKIRVDNIYFVGGAKQSKDNTSQYPKATDTPQAATSEAAPSAPQEDDIPF
jgi:single-strand DNA-binding protein